MVIAAKAGDRTAFERLYGLYVRMVHGIILARVPRTEVEDLVQDVFVQALSRLAGLRDAVAFPGWLAAIARNRANDYHRRSHETIELPADLSGGSEPNPEAAMVLEAIRSLPDAYREPLILRLLEGMTGPEISARTGLKADSVRVNLHRGFKLLRARLDTKASKAAEELL